MDKRVSGLFDLSGRVALVTGGNSGIGKGIAWALAAAGAKVLLVARREPELRATAEELAREGFASFALTCDLADRASVALMCSSAPQAFGAPDILVNAAGTNPRKPFDQNQDADWDRTVELNLTVPFLLTRAFAPAMRERGWGRILNIASLQSVRAFPNSAPYGASKGGLVQLTRAIAQAWSRHRITCNAIAPGLFRTPLTAPLYADARTAQAMAERTMVGRNGEVPDIYGTAVFLASEASSFMTGQTLFLDGGLTAG